MLNIKPARYYTLRLVHYVMIQYHQYGVPLCHLFLDSPSQKWMMRVLATWRGGGEGEGGGKKLLLSTYIFLPTIKPLYNTSTHRVEHKNAICTKKNSGIHVCIQCYQSRYQKISNIGFSYFYSFASQGLQLFFISTRVIYSIRYQFVSILFWFVLLSLFIVVLSSISFFVCIRISSIIIVLSLLSFFSF